MSSIVTFELVARQPWQPGPDGQWITHAHVSPHEPFQPFAFYITQNAEAVRLEWLRIASTEILRGVPGSLLAPGADDRLGEKPERASSNLGEIAAVTMPGHAIEIELRRSIGSSELDVRALVIGSKASRTDEREVRRVAREIDLASRFFEALITGAERERRSAADLKPARVLAFELARDFLAESERLEGVTAALPFGYRRF